MIGINSPLIIRIPFKEIITAMTYNQSQLQTSHIDNKNDWGNGMNKFHPERLIVEYRNGVSATEPIIPRNYTLTHSDLTGQLFLTIGTQFAWDKVNTDLRDEVIGEWKTNGDFLHYNTYVYLDKEEYDLHAAIQRNDIFRRELPLALTAIRYGDQALFALYPQLDCALIIVHFLSAYPQLLKQESWGTFSHFSI